MKYLALLALCVAAGASASTPSAWRANDRAAAAACIQASGFPRATVTLPPNRPRFGDDVGYDALLVTGVHPQPHMRGQRGTVLCLWQRAARRAHVVEARGWRG